MVKESLPKDFNYICFRLDRISLVPVTLTLILGNIHMPALNALCGLYGPLSKAVDRWACLASGDKSLQSVLHSQ